MQINVTYDSSVSGAPAGFTTAVNAAVAYFEANLDAPVTVNITIGWGSVGGDTLPNGAVGATVPAGYLFNYQEVRNALWADARTSSALTAAMNLPAADPTNGGTIFMTSAEAKALGLVSGQDSASDGTIVIDPNTAYSFDPNNRAVAGEVDLVGVLEHEIGHVLGRVSFLGEALPGGSTLYGSLDLFRYSAPGVLSPTATNASFSINGQNLLMPFNDPANGGDSDDWSISQTGDSFDAFADTGVQEQVSSTDLTMLDVFGFHPQVAQPTTPGPGNGMVALVEQGGAFVDINQTSFITSYLTTLYGYQLRAQVGPVANNGTVTSIAASGNDSAAFYVPIGGDVDPGAVFTNSQTGVIMAEASGSATSYDFYYETSGPQIVNAGLMQSVSQALAIGIYSYSIADSLTNTSTGTLRVWGGDGAIGVFSGNGGVLNNSGLIDVTGQNYAIGVAGIINFTNSGTIRATSLDGNQPSVAVDIYTHSPGGAGLFTNSGTIAADYAFRVDQSSTSPPFEPNVDIVNSGTVIGAIDLGNGINQIHNTGIIGGNIYFGDSAATYDGANGHLYGDIFLGYAANTVTLGNDGDTVYGGGDSDTITGGAGNDTFMIARGANHIDGGGGFNTLSLEAAASPYTVDLGAGTAVGAGTSTIANIQEVIAGQYADTLKAGATAATLVGGAGYDTLIGGAGNDTLIAGSGGDTMTGGGGNNSFLYSAGDQQLVITDFDANGDQDVLDIYGYASATSMQQEGADTLITLSGGDSILLKNVQASSLTGGRAPVYNAADYNAPITSSPLPVFGTTPITLDYALTVYASERIAMDFGSATGESDGITPSSDTAANRTTWDSIDNFGNVSFTASGGALYGVAAALVVTIPTNSFVNEAGATFSVTNSNGEAGGIAGYFQTIRNAGSISVTAPQATQRVDGIDFYNLGSTEVTNTSTGTITVQSGASAAGLASDSSAYVENDGRINVSGTGTVYGIIEDQFHPVQGSAALVNTGTIQVTGTSGSTTYGIALGGNDVPSSPPEVDNSGTISAQIAVGSIDTGLSDNASTSILLKNTGVIDGNISLGGYVSQIVNAGGTIDGNILLHDDFNFPAERTANDVQGGDTVDLRGGTFTGTISISPGQAGDVNDHHTIYTGSATTTVKFAAGQSQMTALVQADVTGNVTVQYDIASSAASWSQNSDGSWTVSAGTDGTETLVNVSALQFTDRTVSITANRPPVVTTANVTEGHFQTIPLSSLFTASDPDGDTITQYELWESSRDPLAGHFVVNGVAQPAGTAINITAAQLSQTYFVTGLTSASLQIRANDGHVWSAADNANWAPFTVSVADNPPVVTTTNLTESHLQTLALSSLFSASDPDGDAITQYQLWDSTSDPNGGYFTVNGVAQPAHTVITISAAQLAQTDFVTGSVGASLQIRASDGLDWSASDSASWAPFTISVPADHAPVVTTRNVNIAAGHTLSFSSLVSVTDADSDAITQYQLWDSTRDPNAGHWVVNGVVQSAGQTITITAAQAAQTVFVTGSVATALQVRASDGILWSAADNANWAPFTVAQQPPVLTTSNQALVPGTSVALSTLFSASDPDGDAFTEYQIWDSTRDPNAGYVTVNGVRQAAGTVIDITAAQLAQTSFVAGTVATGLQIRAYDGNVWSAAANADWSPFTVSPPPPVLTTANLTQAAGQTLSLSSLFSVSDANGRSMTQYELWDSTRDSNAGYFIINGAVQAAGTVIEVSAAQLSQTSFVTGTVATSLQIRANDGLGWSAPDNGSWAPFTVSPPVIYPPVVTTQTVTAHHDQTIPFLSLFSVSDANGDAITKYQAWDSTSDPNSGYFVVDGQVQPASTEINISAAQAATATFVTGTVGDNLQIRAYDGQSWSAAENANWAPFNVSVLPNSPPVVTTSDINTTAGQTLALSSLFSVSDADGDTMTKYELWDSTGDPNSGHFVVNGVAQAAHTVIDITAAQLSQTSFLTGSVGDALQIRAFDGQAWSAADTASWSPFHINVS